MTIGVRAANFVASELKIASLKRILWANSTFVLLHWLKTYKPLPVFADNRVIEVLKATDISFCYVSSNENTADLRTRGLSGEEISEVKLW